MPPAVIAFDLIMALAKETPALLTAIANIAKSDADPEMIAAERKALLEGFDTTDPLRPGA